MDEGKIIQRLISLEDKVDGLATKDELGEFKEEVMTALDRQTVILMRLDHELVAFRAKGDRHEERIERLEKHVGIE